MLLTCPSTPPIPTFHHLHDTHTHTHKHTHIKHTHTTHTHTFTHIKHTHTSNTSQPTELTLCCVRYVCVRACTLDYACPAPSHATPCMMCFTCTASSIRYACV